MTVGKPATSCATSARSHVAHMRHISRDKMRHHLSRARARKALLVVFHSDAVEPDVMAVFMPWDVLGLSAEAIGDLPLFEPAPA